MNTQLKHTESLNSNFNKNLEYAYELSNQEFSHEELVNMLTDGELIEKQIAAIKFDYIKTKDDAYVLLSNLTGCDGKIREAVAYKLNQIISNDILSRKIVASISANILADATIDINANICRLIVDTCAMMSEFIEFSGKYTYNIIKFAKEALSELDKFIFKDKKYIINKQLFKLYWSLEALSIFYEFADKSDLIYIINKSTEQTEYTIREKVANIINKSGSYLNEKNKLITDENYYVRQIFTSSKHSLTNQDDHPLNNR